MCTADACMGASFAQRLGQSQPSHGCGRPGQWRWLELSESLKHCFISPGVGMASQWCFKFWSLHFHWVWQWPPQCVCVISSCIESRFVMALWQTSKMSARCNWVSYELLHILSHGITNHIFILKSLGAYVNMKAWKSCVRAASSPARAQSGPSQHLVSAQ